MMDFGEAIRAMREGHRVQRAGWNGKGMWVALVTPDASRHTSGANPNAQTNETRCESPDLPPNCSPAWELPVNPFFVMKTADDRVTVGWLASQTDMVATDWELVGVLRERDPYAPLPLEQAREAFDHHGQLPRSWRECIGARAKHMGVLGTLGFNGQCITFVPDDRREMVAAIREELCRPQVGHPLPAQADAMLFAEGALGYPTYEVDSDMIHERIAGVVVLRRRAKR